MDALPGIGHACGHNLIGISGVAVALAAKAAMERLNIDGKVVLLGTPAEEGGFGKITTRWIAHAGLSPWEGRNALDAAVLAYNNIAILRQQIKPTHRVHGIFEGKDWGPNIIPDQAIMQWLVRAPTTLEMEDTKRRATACFEAAALASECKVQITLKSTINEITQNKALSDELADVVLKRHGTIDYEWGIKSASTDFGNISYCASDLHDWGWATLTNEVLVLSHDACFMVSKALAAVGMRVLTDEAFFQKVKDTFEEDKKLKM
ncbi:hypothetical protein BDR03DRAFT_1012442 [Suillus americanus]|nr:hypothetical protein BDR03DRAFT_1012442 [Suillus americanus]